LTPSPSAAETEEAPAKVNLYLHVLGRRPDGYHDLDSLAVFAPIADRLHFTPASALTLDLEGPFGAELAAEPDNLVLRAARAAAEAAERPARVAIRLEKNLPLASGIGGGSADAAATLRVLGRWWGLSAEVLYALAARLGADVPVCLSGKPARLQGTGTRLAAAPRLPPFGLLLVNPRVMVPTGPVFKALGQPQNRPADLPPAWEDARQMAADLARLGNDLEAPALRLAPVIGDVLTRLRALPGVLLARMSGSGATCFALFASQEEARRAARHLGETKWWVAA
jgi:4-diphosphocytidyl-2-C-methyl-D-erythritol kinase